MNDLWQFDAGKWTRLLMLGVLPEPRSNHHIVCDERTGRVYLHGGGGKGKVRFGDVWELQPEQLRWFPLQSMTPRTYHSACSGDGRLFVYGGVNEFDIAALEVLDLDSLKIVALEQTGSDQPQARRFCSLNYLSNSIVLVGGCHSNYDAISSIFVGALTSSSDSLHVAWSRLEHKFQRWGHASVTYGSGIWICGGRSAATDMMDLVHLELEPQVVANTNTIAVRRKHTSTLIGNTIVSFGGFNGEYLSDLSYIELKEPRRAKPGNFRETLEALLISGLSSDLILKHDDHQYHLHRFIVNDALTNHDSGTIMMSCQLTQQSLEALIKFLYTGQIDDKMLPLINAQTTFNLESVPSRDQNTIAQTLAGTITKYTKQECTCSPRFIAVPAQAYSILLAHAEDFHWIVSTFSYAGDVLLVSNDGFRFSCHKALLGVQSGFLQALLSTPYRDSSSSEIRLEEFRAAQLLPLIMYLYSGCLVHCDQCSQAELHEMLMIAQYLDITTMVELLRDLLLSRLSRSNVHETFRIAMAIEDSYLARCCSHLLTEEPLLEITNNVQLKQCIEQAKKERVIPLMFRKTPTTKTRRRIANKENLG